MANTATLPVADLTPAAILPLFFKLPLRNRVGLLFAAALSIALLVAGWLWTQAPDYKVLFTGIADKDGGAVVAALGTMNVPYKMSESGGAILVPANQVHETRLRLASQGLPRGGTAGFDFMESPKFGITQFQEQVHYQRAIEGELARSIQSLSAVRGARVHIALPKQSVFLKDTQKPTASVLVSLYPGKTLERAQISGIMHLVSSSLPELSPKNVSVVDDTGNLLSPSTDAGTAGQLDANQLSYVHRIEDSYNKRVHDILTPLYGEGNVHAQVKAEIDFSEAESTSEVFKPNQSTSEAAVRSMQVSEAPGGAAGASGVPGALSNQPPATPSAPIQGGAATNPVATGQAPPGGLKRDATTNYELDKTVRHVRSSAGVVRRLSAAVVVNHRKTTSGGKAQTSPLTAEELAQVNALVKEAIGFQKERGDSINVVNAAFTAAAPLLLPDLPFWKQQDTMAAAREAGKYTLITLLSLYLVFGLIRPALRNLSAPVTIGSGDATADADAAAAAETQDALAALPSPLDSARQMAKQDPKVVANVVRNWVSGNE